MVGIRDKLDHERHKLFFDYWCQKAPARGALPGRQHIDPIDIPQVMPWVFLIDVVREGERLRFRLRLVGTQIAEHEGRETTGQFFDELYTDEHIAHLKPIYDEVVRTGEPHFYHSDVGVPHGEEIERFSFSRLLCPFAADGKTVDLLAAVMVFYDEDGEELPPAGI